MILSEGKVDNHTKKKMKLQGYVKFDSCVIYEPLKDRIIKEASCRGLELKMTSNNASFFKSGLITYEVEGLEKNVIEFDGVIKKVINSLRFI